MKSPTLGEAQRLRKFEKWVPIKMSGPKEGRSNRRLEKTV